MRSPLKLVLAAAILVGIGLLAWRQQQRRTEADATRAALGEASAAMKQLNAEDASFPPAFQRAMTRATSELLAGPQRAAAAVQREVIPMLDGYLATIARALQRADAYLARAADGPSRDAAAELRPAIERIRARGAQLRELRANLAALPARVDAGATADELASSLASAGAALLLQELAPH